MSLRTTLCVCAVLFLWALAEGQQESAGQNSRLLIEASQPQKGEGVLPIDRLLVGEPLIGAVEQGERLMFHFGVLSRGKDLPDVLLYLEAVDSAARVEMYCVPRQKFSQSSPPDRITANWKTSGSGQIFISSKSQAYREALFDKVIDGEEKRVAEFGCALWGVLGGPTKFQLTARLTFDQRALIPEQQKAMKEIFNKCCLEQGRCGPWKTPEHEPTGKSEIEFDFCHRTGSFCNVNGDLLRLDLHGYDLKCPLPVEALLKLTTLESLDLSNNTLHADIVEDVSRLGQLRRMQELNLANNFVFGEMDVPGLCRDLLRRLRTINLDDNHMTGRLPSCVYTDSLSLEEVYLSRNYFSGYVSDLFPPLSPLKVLALSGNELTGTLPQSLGRLKRLKVLYLDGNSFNGPIPNSFALLKNVEILDLSKNRLSSFPSSWSSDWEPSKALRVLELQNNKIHGELPKRLLRARSLEWLDLSSNFISGNLFAKKGMFPKLMHFNVSRNHLTGSIPAELASMGLFGNARRTGPTHAFDLSFNQLDGQIPYFMYQEETPDIAETNIFLEGNNLRCHRGMTLNYIPNFECETHQTSSRVGRFREGKDYLESERDQRQRVSAFFPAGASRLNAASDDFNVDLKTASEDGTGKNKAADATVAAVSAILGAAIIGSIVVLVIKFKRRRERRLGLQYGAADDLDSEDGLPTPIPNGDPGPSCEPPDEAEIHPATRSVES